jgi:hypothetical protein
MLCWLTYQNDGIMLPLVPILLHSLAMVFVMASQLQKV